MREQAMTHRVGDRGGAYGKRRAGATSQKPAKRRSDSGEGLGARLRSLAHYLPLAGKLVLLALVIALAVTGYRAAASASFFQVRNVEVRGVTRASTADIQGVVRRLAGQNGVWRADVAAMSAQIERLPWVRTAIVSRVLPDSVRVRITERAQRAVVRLSSGRLVWVDDDAVVLSEMLPADQMPAFFLRGWEEDKSEIATTGNRERVRKYLQLVRELEASGVANRVSEVNLADLREVRAQLTGDDSQIEIRLGGDDLGLRLEKGLKVLDAQRQTPVGPYITYIIMSQKTPIIGHSVTPNNNNSADQAPAAETPSTRTAKTVSSRPEKRKRATRAESTRDQSVTTQADSRKRRVNEPRP
jgi:cell division septal protein FtsQ